jgi:cytochrome c-type biogenesis protein
MGGVSELVQSGPLLLAMPVAAAAGAITFLSPCCLPLVPGYLSYITGMSGTGLQDSGGAKKSAAAMVGATVPGAVAAAAPSGSAQAAASQPAGADAQKGPTARTYGRGRAVTGTALFVLGFSALFASYGLAFGSIGDTLKAHEQVVSQALGCLLIALGLLFAGAFDRFTLAGRVFRPSIRPRAGLAGAPLLGVLFGLGWTPCIGPTLAAVLTLSETTGTAARGATLAFVYGLGLGIPFLIVAFAFQRGISMFGFARRHGQLITRIGGIMLIAVGVLEVTGAWATAMTWLQVHWIQGYNAPL